MNKEEILWKNFIDKLSGTGNKKLAFLKSVSYFDRLLISNAVSNTFLIRLITASN